jgi:hypothetical protein
MGLQEAPVYGRRNPAHRPLARRRHRKPRKVAREARADRVAPAARRAAGRDKAGGGDGPPGEGFPVVDAPAVDQQPQQLKCGLLICWGGGESLQLAG